jgi:hypothetical protein
VQQKGRKARRRRLKGKRGRGTKANEKPPVLGMLQRDGLVKVALLEDVKRKMVFPRTSGGMEKSTFHHPNHQQNDHQEDVFEGV